MPLLVRHPATPPGAIQAIDVELSRVPGGALASFSVIFVVSAYSFRTVGCTWIILAGVTLFFAGIAALYYTRRHPRMFVARINVSKPEHQGTKIVPLTKDIVLEQQNLKG